MTARNARSAWSAVGWIALAVGVLAAAFVVFSLLTSVPPGNATLSLIPAIVSAVSLVLSAVAFLLNLSTKRRPERPVGSTVASGTGSIAAGRDADGNATGTGASVVIRQRRAGADTPIRPTTVLASGDGSIAAGRDVTGNATGDSSTVS